MMHQGTRRFSQPQRLSERFYHIFCLQVFPNMVAHNFSGAGIGDQTQIGRTIAQWKVSNIGDPDLFWFKSGNLFRAQGKITKARSPQGLAPDTFCPWLLFASYVLTLP